MRYQRLSILRIAALTMTILVAMTTSAGAQDDAASRLAAAYELAYNLDHDDAVREMQAVAKLAPELSTTYRALASVTWLRYLFDRGTVLVDEYLGRISKRDVSSAAAPPEVADRFQRYLSTAIRLAEQRVAQHPRDAGALYELSSSLGLQASWAATVDGRMSRAFGSARRAYRTAERASALSPASIEPRLVLGTYRYVVAGLSLPVRMVAFVAGMDGDRARACSWSRTPPGPATAPYGPKRASRSYSSTTVKNAGTTAWPSLPICARRTRATGCCGSKRQRPRSGRDGLAMPNAG